jgi:hypothetical protein
MPYRERAHTIIEQGEIHRLVGLYIEMTDELYAEIQKLLASVAETASDEKLLPLFAEARARFVEALKKWDASARDLPDGAGEILEMQRLLAQTPLIFWDVDIILEALRSPDEPKSKKGKKAKAITKKIKDAVPDKLPLPGPFGDIDLKWVKKILNEILDSLL